MQFIHYIFRTISHEIFIICLLSICIAFNNKFFTVVFITLLFGTTFNNFLKEMWQIPLNPALGKEGFAFPSGHMQSCGIVYFAIAMYIRRWWCWLLTIIILYAIGESMEFFGYHTWPDMIAALGISAILVLIIYLLIPLFIASTKATICFMILISIAQLLLMLLTFQKPLSYYWWLWQTLGATIGITTGFYYLSYSKFSVLRPGKERTVKIVGACFSISMVSVFIALSHAANALQSHYLTNVLYFILALFLGIYIEYLSIILARRVII